MSYKKFKQKISSEYTNEELREMYENKMNFLSKYFPNVELGVTDYFKEIFKEAIKKNIMMSDCEFKTGKGNGLMFLYSPKQSKKKYKKGPFIRVKEPLLLTTTNISNLNIEGFSGVNVSNNLHYGKDWKLNNLAYYLNFDIFLYGVYDSKKMSRFIKMMEDGKILKPTIISSTETGIHLIYRLKNPIKVYKKDTVKMILLAVKKALHAKINTSYFLKSQYADKITNIRLMNRVRCISTTTKYGEYLANNREEAKANCVKAWKIGESYSLGEIVEYSNEYLDKSMKRAAFEGMILESPEFEEKSFMEVVESGFERLSRYIKYENENDGNGFEQRTFSYGNKKYRFTGINVYNGWLKKAKNTSQDKYIYAFLGLAAYALKCNVQESEFRKDLRQLKNFFEKRDNYQIPNDEIVSVINKYKNDMSLKYLKGETIANRCGLEIVKCKRNGRTQAEHLEMIRGMGGRKSMKEDVLIFLKSQFEKGIDVEKMSTREIEKLSGISKSTVSKYKKECLQIIMHS